MAERRIQIVQLPALKLWRASQKEALLVTQSHCVSEAAMASNLMLTYGGVTPCQALFGYQPRELYDFEEAGLAAVDGSLQSAPDFIEESLRLRLMAKDCILQSVVEDRIARAANTRVQQHKPEDMAKLVEDAKVDSWREPTNKEDPCWRGPA